MNPAGIHRRLPLRPRALAAHFALPEILILGFALFCAAATFAFGRNDGQLRHAAIILGSAAAFAALTVALRRHPPRIRPALLDGIHRFLTIGLVLGLFFNLRWVIDAVHPGEYDHIYDAIDSWFLGAPAAVLWEPYQTEGWVEWFAFFYWSYFYVIALYIFPHAAVLPAGEEVTAFGGGIILAHVVGWSCYLVLPGLGPYHYLAGEFAGDLPGRFHAMSFAAYSTGPLHDIFPSLHTCVTTFLCLHALAGRRRHRLYRVIAWPLVFWGSQVIIGTVYLRWHYVVDVAAGFGLAVACHLGAPRLARGWAAWRTARGAADPWW